MTPSDVTATDAALSPPLSWGTRAAFAGALVLLGLLLVVAARTGDMPSESRTSSRVELVELIRTEEARVDALVARVDELSKQVAAYQDARQPGAEVVAAIQHQVDALAPAAGMTAVQGPGVVASLNDSTSTPSAGEDVNSYVIHEQDLQAVINALWAGGAEAMTVNGQRVLATTAIRCVGNTLLLHGGVYSPPYIVAAVGDELALRTALERDLMVQQFTAAVKTYDLGWSVATEPLLALPSYEGTAGMQVARPVSGGVAG